MPSAAEIPATILLWHRTTKAQAEIIPREGFRDGRGRYMTNPEWSGVWFSARPLDANEGACGDALLRVDFACAEDEISDSNGWMKASLIENG